MPARPRSRRGGRPRRRCVATSDRRRVRTRHRLLPHRTLGRSRTASLRGAPLVGGNRHRATPIPRPLAACAHRRRERSVGRVEDLTTSLRRWAAPRAMAFARYAAHADALAAARSGLSWTWSKLPCAQAGTRMPEHCASSTGSRHRRDLVPDEPSGNSGRSCRGYGRPLASFRAALNAVDVDTWSFDTARVRLLHGEELHRRGRIAEARAELFVARQTFSDLDAAPWFTRASDELRSTGLRELGRPSGTTADLLTPQQARIARVSSHVASRTKRSAESSTSRRGPCLRTCTRSSPSSTSRPEPASETPSQHPPAPVENSCL
jgi:hypothetical protein